MIFDGYHQSKRTRVRSMFLMSLMTRSNNFIFSFGYLSLYEFVTIVRSDRYKKIILIVGYNFLIVIRTIKEKKIQQNITCNLYILQTSIYLFASAVAERLRHCSREQRVPSSSPAWISVLR